MKNFSIGVDIEDIASFAKLDIEKDHLFFIEYSLRKKLNTASPNPLIFHILQ